MFIITVSSNGAFTTRPLPPPPEGPPAANAAANHNEQTDIWVFPGGSAPHVPIEDSERKSRSDLLQ
eukprot:140711-Prorocentrum_minimum.AAC.11